MMNCSTLASLSFALACALMLSSATPVRARQDRSAQDPPAEAQDDETIKVNTELIQAGAAVFDKRGQFVGGLKAEDFELRVDGELVALSFFESFNPESARAAAAQSSGRKTDQPAEPILGQRRRGQTFLFFVDDLHLSNDSYRRTRDLIRHFVTNEMSSDDLVGLVSPSGKVGFLQQFTDQAEVVLAAAERLRYGRDSTATDISPPPMTEYEALSIDRYDPEVTNAFVRLYLSMGLSTSQDDATLQVRSRARNVLARAAQLSRRTYLTLEQAVRRTTALPGRKIVFFISDGFFLDQTNTNSAEHVRRITDAAARANAVIHTLDPKGIPDHMPAGTAGTFRTRSGELWEQQDPLSIFAENTGGRFVKNTNDLRPALAEVVTESSAYYLLAWRPEPGSADKFRRITVQVKGRPDLRVRVQNGFLNSAREAARAPAPAATERAASPPDALREALGSQHPLRALPVALTVNYYDAPGLGPALMAAVRIEGNALRFITEGDKTTGVVRLTGIVFDAEGKQHDAFGERMTVSGAASAEGSAAAPPLFYNYRTTVKPGLYQVRVAARDEQGGLVGSAARWVEVEDISARRLALSSLLVGERPRDASSPRAAQPAALLPTGEATLSVDRRFARDSQLRYVLYVYNANRGRAGTAQPNVALRTRIYRDGSIILDGAETNLSTEGQDPTRLAYAAEIPLERLAPGRYVLEVTATDRAAKATKSRRFSFEVR
jgi:VWFA-related protein